MWLGPSSPTPPFPASISTLLDGCCPRTPMHTTDIATGDEVPTLRRAYPTPATVGLEMCRNSKCFLERGVGGGHKICIWLTLHLYDVLFKQRQDKPGCKCVHLRQLQIMYVPSGFWGQSLRPHPGSPQDPAGNFGPQTRCAQTLVTSLTPTLTQFSHITI